MHAAPPPDSPTATRVSTEDGFSIIELMVVCIVAAILMAIAIPTFMGARESGHRDATISAASSYAQAVTAFRTQNANILPVPGNATQWPNLQRGPIDKFGKPLMPEVPSTVLAGSVGFCAYPATCAKTSGFVQYQRAANNLGFAMLVHTIKDGELVPWCAINVGAKIPAGFEACTRK